MIISALVAIGALALTALQLKAWRWFKKKPDDFGMNIRRREPGQSVNGYMRALTYDRLKYNLWLQRQRQHKSHNRGRL